PVPDGRGAAGSTGSGMPGGQQCLHADGRRRGIAGESALQPFSLTRMDFSLWSRTALDFPSWYPNATSRSNLRALEPTLRIAPPSGLRYAPGAVRVPASREVEAPRLLGELRELLRLAVPVAAAQAG